ncbi:hypothetical protein BRD00_06380 [Halobacteriales archaeon QS_8_69_26]|nr:MAG: hypothetical protein BRD00_06380 [Halobacteriales archaeon QS_8_69_26]
MRASLRPSYTVDTTVNDAAGNSGSDSTSVTEGEPNGTPAVDSLSASEVETSDSDAEFDADRSVSDDDGDLDSVDLTLTDDTDGETEDTATVSVSGSSASGTTRLVAAGDDGSGNSYTVEATVSDADGASSSDTTTASETEPTSDPAIDFYTVTEAGSPNPHAEFTADWAVSDADGDLSQVDVVVYDSSGAQVDSSTTSVSGSSASGTDQFKIEEAQNETFDVVLTVTDANGNTTSDTRTVTE